MSKQVERTVLRKQVSDHFSTIKRHIEKLKAGGSTGSVSGASSNMDMVVKSLEDAISRLEKEKKPYIGIVDDIKNAKILLASVKKQAK
jgi:molybdenum-dependent DNA-binding transcriptional regulator ModE